MLEAAAPGYPGPAGSSDRPDAQPSADICCGRALGPPPGTAGQETQGPERHKPDHAVHVDAGWVRCAAGALQRPERRGYRITHCEPAGSTARAAHRFLRELTADACAR